jgi:hypothetical protein
VQLYKTEQNELGGQVSLEGFKAHCGHCTGGKGVPVPDCPRVEGIPSNIGGTLLLSE